MIFNQYQTSNDQLMSRKNMTSSPSVGFGSSAHLTNQTTTAAQLQNAMSLVKLKMENKQQQVMFSRDTSVTQLDEKAEYVSD